MSSAIFDPDNVSCGADRSISRRCLWFMLYQWFGVGRQRALPVTFQKVQNPREGANSEDCLSNSVQREKDTKGEEARKRLQFVLLTTDHLDDVTAGSSYLKNLPGIDSRRIAVVGHSFGGQLTLLAAERDTSLRAAVTFSAAASSWESSSEVRERMLAAVQKTTVPIMLLHAENDYSTAPRQGDV